MVTHRLLLLLLHFCVAVRVFVFLDDWQLRLAVMSMVTPLFAMLFLTLSVVLVTALVWLLWLLSLSLDNRLGKWNLDFHFRGFGRFLHGLDWLDFGLGLIII